MPSIQDFYSSDQIYAKSRNETKQKSIAAMRSTFEVHVIYLILILLPNFDPPENVKLISPGLSAQPLLKRTHSVFRRKEDGSCHSSSVPLH